MLALRVLGRGADVGYRPDASLLVEAAYYLAAYASAYAAGVTVPEVLTFREFRENLADTLRRVQEPDAEPVYVGPHRRPQAVVVSASRYEHLAALERREAVADALASVRVEGLEPSPEGAQLLAAVADGRLSTEQARQAVLSRYRR